MTLESGSIKKEPLPGIVGVKAFLTQDGYSVYFDDKEKAIEFVKLFWEQDDLIVGRPPESSVSNRFKGGMWKPEQELTQGCRTRIDNPTDFLEEGAKAVVVIYGNGNPLQDHAQQALENLIDL